MTEYNPELGTDMYVKIVWVVLTIQCNTCNHRATIAKEGTAMKLTGNHEDMGLGKIKCRKCGGIDLELLDVKDK